MTSLQTMNTLLNSASILETLQGQSQGDTTKHSLMTTDRELDRVSLLPGEPEESTPILKHKITMLYSIVKRFEILDFISDRCQFSCKIYSC